MTTCNKQLGLEGKAFPQRCDECQLGPCPHYDLPNKEGGVTVQDIFDHLKEDIETAKKELMDILNDDDVNGWNMDKAKKHLDEGVRQRVEALQAFKILVNGVRVRKSLK